MDKFYKGKFHELYLSDSKLTPCHFYKGLLEQLGSESKFYRGDAKRQLHREIELMKGIRGLQPVVVVDEAHLLDREMLEEVRFLQNFISLIIVGQSGLWDQLRLQSYAAIRQRIDIQFQLGRLDRAQVEEYVTRHFRYAEVEQPIFQMGRLTKLIGFQVVPQGSLINFVHIVFCMAHKMVAGSLTILCLSKSSRGNFHENSLERDELQ